MILRDRDASSGTGAADGTLEERRYYLQNWRADVVAIVRSSGDPVEYVRYSAYGEPTSYPVADVNRDGVVDASDAADWVDLYAGGGGGTIAVGLDLNRDGVEDSADDDLFYESYNAASGHVGRGVLSSEGVGNAKGYAGYEWDAAVSMNHVRHRVYVPEIGRWTRRDPLGYVDGVGLMSYTLEQAAIIVSPSWSEWSYAQREVVATAISTFGGCKGTGCEPIGHSRARWCSLYNSVAVCRADAIVRPEPPGPLCDGYAPDYLYSCTNAKCSCRCAGNSPWANYVRRCLACMYARGCGGNESHIACYEAAMMDVGAPPADTLAMCVVLCVDTGCVTKKFIPILPRVPPSLPIGPMLP